VHTADFINVTLQAELDVDRSASLNVPAAQGIAEEVPPRQLYVQENKRILSLQLCTTPYIYNQLTTVYALQYIYTY